jgi:hypothetical protein
MKELNEWAIIEIKGYRKVAGKITSETLAGFEFLRVDIYSSPEKIELTEYYNPSSIHSIIPVSVETAILFAKNTTHKPIANWELQNNPMIEQDIPL